MTPSTRSWSWKKQVQYKQTYETDEPHAWKLNVVVSLYLTKMELWRSPVVERSKKKNIVTLLSPWGKFWFLMSGQNQSVTSQKESCALRSSEAILVTREFCMMWLFYFIFYIYFQCWKEILLVVKNWAFLVFGLRLCCAVALMTYAAVKWGLGLRGTVIIEGLWIVLGFEREHERLGGQLKLDSASCPKPADRSRFSPRPSWHDGKQTDGCFDSRHRN